VKAGDPDDLSVMTVRVTHAGDLSDLLVERHGGDERIGSLSGSQ
jgi:hypothetical protein